MQKNNIFKFQLNSRLVTNVLLVLGALTSQAATLDDAIKRALMLDDSLRSSKLNQLATEENIAVARSRLFPQISIQGSSSQITQTTSQEFATGGSSSRSFSGPSVNHQIVIRQALIRPKELSSLRYAELQTQYMELKYKYDVAELKSKVINAWVDLSGAHQIAQALERPLIYMQIAAKQERAKFEQGDSTKDAVMEADAQYINAKAIHVQSLEILKTKQKIFENITTISTDELVEEKINISETKELVTFNKVDVWEKVRNTSLELQMVRLQELMQLERMRQAETEHKPTLDLLAAVNFAQNDATSTQGYQYKNKQVGLQYSIPIFNGGALSASVRQAKLSYEAAVSDSSAQSKKIENDFENNWGQYRGNYNRLIAAFELLRSNEEQIKNVTFSVQLGVKTMSDLVSLENAYSRKKIELITLIQDILRLQNKLKIS